jgi:hypothetical protein
LSAHAYAQPAPPGRIAYGGSNVQPDTVGFPPNGSNTNVNVAFNLSFPNQASLTADQKAAELAKAQQALIGLAKTECDRLHLALGMACKLTQLKMNTAAASNHNNIVQYVKTAAIATYALTNATRP